MKNNARKYTFRLRKILHLEDGSIRMEAEVSPDYWREPEPWALIKAAISTDGIFEVYEYELADDDSDVWAGMWKPDEEVKELLLCNETGCMSLFFLAQEYAAIISIISTGAGYPEIRVPAPAVQVAIAAEGERRLA